MHPYLKNFRLRPEKLPPFSFAEGDGRQIIVKRDWCSVVTLTNEAGAKIFTAESGS